MKREKQWVWCKNFRQVTQFQHPNDGPDEWRVAKDNNKVQTTHSTGRQYKPQQRPQRGEGGTEEEKDENEMMDMLPLDHDLAEVEGGDCHVGPHAWCVV